MGGALHKGIILCKYHDSSHKASLAQFHMSNGSTVMVTSSELFYDRPDRKSLVTEKNWVSQCGTVPAVTSSLGCISTQFPPCN